MANRVLCFQKIFNLFRCQDDASAKRIMWQIVFFVFNRFSICLYLIRCQDDANVANRVLSRFQKIFFRFLNDRARLFR